MYDDYCELLSNYVIVVSLIRGHGIKNNYCGLPYWRLKNHLCDFFVKYNNYIIFLLKISIIC